MLVKKISRWVLSTLTVMLTIGGMVWGLGAMTTSVQAADEIEPQFAPSADPIGLSGIYMNTGFALQPQSQYTYLNNPKTLTTATAHSILDSINFGGTDHITWYQSIDNGKSWTIVPNEKSADLTVTPTTTGVVYYQQRFEYYLIPPILFHTYYYSKVASVTTSEKPIDATSLTVATKDNYLYNNQSTAATTYAYATTTPENTTGTVSWSIDDTSLATIDKATGKITANNTKSEEYPDGKSGTATVTGTITKSDGSTISATTKIIIGGGLDDKKVNLGQNATFSVHGSFGSTPDSITWHKVDTAGKDTVVNSGTSTTYSTPATTLIDDGSKYYAVIKTTVSGNTATIPTNHASLNVSIGIKDQTVNDTKKATFSIDDDLGVTPSSIVWHKINTNGTDSEVNRGTSTSYTTPATKASDDNGTKYYAVVTATINGKDKTFTTNQATLNVNAVDHTPKVTITTTLTDITNNTGNTEHALNNIQDGDKLKMSGTITENNPDSKLNKADIMIPVPDNIRNTYLYIDGTNQAYSTAQLNGVSYIVASGFDFSKNTTTPHSYEFDFQSMETTDLSFHGKVQIQAYDNNEGDLGIIDGPDFLLNFTDGQLQFKANTVKFGDLTYTNVGKIVTGNVDNNDNLLTVTDNRRNKTAMDIKLTQETPFMNGSKKLQATLSYDDGSGKIPQTITDQPTVVASSTTGNSVPSIGASNGQKLGLTLANQAIQTGAYTSTLDWEITDAP